MKFCFFVLLCSLGIFSQDNITKPEIDPEINIDFKKNIEKDLLNQMRRASKLVKECESDLDRLNNSYHSFENSKRLELTMPIAELIEFGGLHHRRYSKNSMLPSRYEEQEDKPCSISYWNQYEDYTYLLIDQNPSNKREDVSRYKEIISKAKALAIKCIEFKKSQNEPITLKNLLRTTRSLAKKYILEFPESLYLKDVNFTKEGIF